MIVMVKDDGNGRAQRVMDTISQRGDKFFPSRGNERVVVAVFANGSAPVVTEVIAGRQHIIEAALVAEDIVL